MSAPREQLAKLWVVSELYFPEETSTGYLLTRIAEGVARTRPVGVVCAQPTYSERGTVAPRLERRNGVEIRRSWTATLDKDYLPFRIVNLVTVTLAIFLELWRRVRRRDAVLVVTNPPTLPVAAWLACRLRGARPILLVHDVYPDVVVASALASRESRLIRVLDALQRALYRRFEAIVVLGRDMERLVREKLARAPVRVETIPNWADLETIRPTPREESALLRELGLAGKFVLQYAGNMGRSHGIEPILAAARMLRDDGGIHFVFIGSGAKLRLVESAIREEGLPNVTLLGHRPRKERQAFLNACDAAIVAFVPGMAGASVPSRMYDVMAAGKPLLALADLDSELALVVLEERIGWVVPASSPERLADAVRAARDSQETAALGLRARAVAERKYRLDQAIAAYDALLAGLDADRAAS